ncbi:hypothetical protein KC926_03115 [Candidatus Kaiserbacteria bacterium]|nr:hypothetical protein [Candidatus Kaiserbacteria bacterium]
MAKKEAAGKGPEIDQHTNGQFFIFREVPGGHEYYHPESKTWLDKTDDGRNKDGSPRWSAYFSSREEAEAVLSKLQSELATA